MIRLSDVDVLILCGGLGTRISSHLPSDTPKCMADINGRPFIDLLLDNLTGAGFKRFILLTGHLANKIKTRMRVRTNHSDTHLGTGGAIAKCLKENAVSNPFLVVNGDTFCPLNYNDLLIHKGEFLVVIPHDVNYNNLGSFLFNSDLWRQLDNLPPRHDLEYVWAECFKRQLFIKWLKVNTPYYDIGTLEGLQMMRQKKTKIKSTAQTSHLDQLSAMDRWERKAVRDWICQYVCNAILRASNWNVRINQSSRSKKSCERILK